jgi:hypothetical protein
MPAPCNAKPISLGSTPWNEIRPKKYPSPAIPVVQLLQNPWNVRYAIPLVICNSNMRFLKKLHQLSVRGAFLRLFCRMTLDCK